MAKSARKRHAGLTVVTQDAADLLGSDLGQVVLANAATQILMRQAPQAIDAVADAFDLTTGEARLLLAAPQGEALLIAGTARVAYRAVASPTEHHLLTSAAGQTVDDVRPGRRVAAMATTARAVPVAAGRAGRRCGRAWSCSPRPPSRSPRSGS